MGDQPSSVPITAVAIVPSQPSYSVRDGINALRNDNAQRGNVHHVTASIVAPNNVTNNQGPYYNPYIYSNQVLGFNVMPVLKGGQRGSAAASGTGYNQENGLAFLPVSFIGSSHNQMPPMKHILFSTDYPYYMNNPHQTSSPPAIITANVLGSAPQLATPSHWSTDIINTDKADSTSHPAESVSTIVGTVVEEEKKDDAAKVLMNMWKQDGDESTSVSQHDAVVSTPAVNEDHDKDTTFPLPPRRHCKLRNYNKPKDPSASRNKKTYRCPHCNYGSTRRSNVNMHIRCHTGERPYKCAFPGCDHRCSQLSNLRAHELTHSSEKIYSCRLDGCRYRTLHMENFNAHQMRKHFASERTHTE